MRLTSILHAGAALLTAQTVTAIALDINDPNSIKAAAKTVAGKMLQWYDPNQPGLLPQTPVKYYWWEAGAMFGSLIDYWRLSGDTSYVNMTTTAMLAQVGKTNNFMPLEQASQLGNDDQAFWGFTAMAAAEYNFPNPPADKPQWLALAQAVFNSQAPRWDNLTCNGGLRWQIFLVNTGYDYKNTISNGAFFNLGARLYRYTGNGTYLNWASTAWDWEWSVGTISQKYEFFDGTDPKINCSRVDHSQWSYNPAVHLHGAAVLYNATGDEIWKTRAQNIWDAMSIFFTPEKIMYEQFCEPSRKCNTDQLSFKAYVSRWMSASMKMAPFLAPQMQPYLDASAVGAAKACTGEADGITCGFQWDASTGYDGLTGVGQQMGALEVIQSQMNKYIDSTPVTNTTGGTSKGNNAAGSTGDLDPHATMTITTADKAGAGIITALLIVVSFGGVWFMIS